MGAIVWLSLATAMLAAGQSGFVALSPPLADWKQEIEQRSGGKLILVRVYTDPLRNEISLPADTEQRPVLRRYFLEESFRAQLAAAHSLALNYSGPEGRFHFVLLNMALASEWNGLEDGLLAHEFGHAWLDALGYPLPAYTAGASSCISVHAGGIVQHILIRAETERRKLPYREYWRRTLDSALAGMRTQRAAGEDPACQALARLALWLDVRLGLSPAAWEGFSEFNALISANFAEIQPFADRIEAYLRALGAPAPERFESRRIYQNALDFTLAAAAELYRRPGEKKPAND